mgnify:CR=1 FL=1
MVQEKVTLKSQQYYILSDDHSVSRDSRTLGAVSKNEIRGSCYHCDPKEKYIIEKRDQKSCFRIWKGM